MCYMKWYMQTTILKPNQEPCEVNGQNQSQVKPKPKAMSHNPSEAKWSQVKPKAKSQKSSGHANGRF